MIRAGYHTSGQGLGEHERGGGLEFAAEQMNRETIRPHQGERRKRVRGCRISAPSPEPVRAWEGHGRSALIGLVSCWVGAPALTPWWMRRTYDVRASYWV